MWAKLDVLSKILAALAIPIILAYIGNQYSTAIKERELQGKFVELAVDILREEPTSETDSLRAWATKVIDRYSGIGLNTAAREKLIKTMTLPFSSQLKVPLSRDKMIDVAPADVRAAMNSLRASGAQEVIQQRQPDGKYTIIGTRWRATQ